MGAEGDVSPDRGSQDASAKDDQVLERGQRMLPTLSGSSFSKLHRIGVGKFVKSCGMETRPTKSVILSQDFSLAALG